MKINKTQLAKLIPHGAGMCLIDRIIDYDEAKIICETESHLNSRNPLADNRKLLSIISVEYAAQAVAIHASLTGQKLSNNKPAYIGSIKNIKLERRLLSDVKETLMIQANCLLSGFDGTIYEFQINSDTPIAHGQINLVSNNQCT